MRDDLSVVMRKPTRLASRRLWFHFACALTLPMGCGVQSVYEQDIENGNLRVAQDLLSPEGTPRFSFKALDGREVSSDAIRGSISVVAFLATFDWASQAQARFVSGIERGHSPRPKCFAVVLELQENRLLVESFVHSLGLTYPVVHATTEELAKTLLGVRAVPTVLVFDVRGRVVWRSKGLATQDAIDVVLDAVEKQ